MSKNDVTTVTTPDGKRHTGEVIEVVRERDNSGGAMLAEVFTLGLVSRDPAIKTVVDEKTGQHFTGECSVI